MNPKKRAELHRMLDELIDENPSSVTGVLLLGEVLVKTQGKLERSLSMRGIVGKNSNLLHDLLRQLKDQ